MALQPDFLPQPGFWRINQVDVAHNECIGRDIEPPAQIAGPARAEQIRIHVVVAEKAPTTADACRFVSPQNALTAPDPKVLLSRRGDFQGARVPVFQMERAGNLENPGNLMSPAQRQAQHQSGSYKVTVDQIGIDLAHQLANRADSSRQRSRSAASAGCNRQSGAWRPSFAMPGPRPRNAPAAPHAPRLRCGQARPPAAPPRTLLPTFC